MSAPQRALALRTDARRVDHGASHELYTVVLPRMLADTTFARAALLIYVSYGALLVAVDLGEDRLRTFGVVACAPA